jgi:hypothetical protein
MAVFLGVFSQGVELFEYLFYRITARHASRPR